MPSHVSAIQFLRFTAAGAVGTVAHYGVLILAVQGLGRDPIPSSICGSVTGAVVNLLLNHYITFRSGARLTETAPRFFLVAGIGMILNWLLMTLLVRSAGIHYLISQVVTTTSVLLVNYFANAIWTFGGRRRGDR
jgi:putative flippase GtrA